jgi:hypothetical protein
LFVGECCRFVFQVKLHTRLERVKEAHRRAVFEYNNLKLDAKDSKRVLAKANRRVQVAKVVLKAARLATQKASQARAKAEARQSKAHYLHMHHHTDATEARFKCTQVFCLYSRC